MERSIGLESDSYHIATNRSGPPALHIRQMFPGIMAFMGKLIRLAIQSSFGRLLDLRGDLTDLPAAEPVANATMRDWVQVGEDIRTSMEEVAQDLPEEQREEVDKRLVAAS